MKLHRKFKKKNSIQEYPAFEHSHNSVLTHSLLSFDVNNRLELYDSKSDNKYYVTVNTGSKAAVW